VGAAERHHQRSRRQLPWGLGEFGTCSNANTAAANDFYLQAKRAFDANTYPRLKMYLAYADTGGPKAGPGS
jgi:hypothetical protein